MKKLDLEKNLPTPSMIFSLVLKMLWQKDNENFWLQSVLIISTLLNTIINNQSISHI